MAQTELRPRATASEVATLLEWLKGQTVTVRQPTIRLASLTMLRLRDGIIPTSAIASETITYHQYDLPEWERRGYLHITRPDPGSSHPEGRDVRLSEAAHLLRELARNHPILETVEEVIAYG